MKDEIGVIIIRRKHIIEGKSKNGNTMPITTDKKYETKKPIFKLRDPDTIYLRINNFISSYINTSENRQSTNYTGTKNFWSR